MNYKCKNCGTIFTDDKYVRFFESEYENEAFICRNCGNILIDLEYGECEFCGSNEFYGACPVCFKKKDEDDCI